ncbi:MAG: 2OG-Fe(II) oxygenase [Acidimicrobiia bacterium]|nr:2OG-Fe(II) oxygenase [Acidimicrobiia bacterium]
MTTEHINVAAHPITEAAYLQRCRELLDATGVLVLDDFFPERTITEIVASSAPQESDAYYANSTHNVYLTAADQTFAADHPHNRQVASSKGLIADDEVPADSPLRSVYEDGDFRSFLCGVLGISEIHPYDDQLSSINVHFAAEGMELGWHFDNSAFAVTMLLQAPLAGGVFEYVPDVRDADAGDQAYEAVGRVLDRVTPVRTLDFAPGALVLFRGRNAMHRVTPTQGDTTRMLVVFAFNDQPGVKLSESALQTFYGRLG